MKTLAKIVGSTGTAAALIALVAQWEGKSNDPYLDITGIPTVCYGETNVPMRRYTDAQCKEMLADSLGNYAKTVLERNPSLRDRPNQLIAASSLTYNIGGNAYWRSTVAKRFAVNDWKGGCEAIKRWNRAGGKVVKGLVNRRAAEYKICMADLG